MAEARTITAIEIPYQRVNNISLKYRYSARAMANGISKNTEMTLEKDLLFKARPRRTIPNANPKPVPKVYAIYSKKLFLALDSVLSTLS